MWPGWKARSSSTFWCGVPSSLLVLSSKTGRGRHVGWGRKEQEGVEGGNFCPYPSWGSIASLVPTSQSPSSASFSSASINWANSLVRFLLSGCMSFSCFPFAVWFLKVVTIKENCPSFVIFLFYLNLNSIGFIFCKFWLSWRSLCRL